MLLLGHAAVSARRGPRGTCQETRAALWAPAECGVSARSASDGVDVNGIRVHHRRLQYRKYQCGMRWEVTPCGQLRGLCCVRTSNPTYISEFGWEGLVAGRGVGLLSTLWDGLCFGLGRGFKMRVLSSRRGVLWLIGSLWLRPLLGLGSCARPTIGRWLRSLRLCGVVRSFGPWCRRGLRGRRRRFRLLVT